MKKNATPQVLNMCNSILFFFNLGVFIITSFIIAFYFPRILSFFLFYVVMGEEFLVGVLCSFVYWHCFSQRKVRMDTAPEYSKCYSNWVLKKGLVCQADFSSCQCPTHSDRRRRHHANHPVATNTTECEIRMKKK